MNPMKHTKKNLALCLTTFALQAMEKKEQEPITPRKQLTAEINQTIVQIETLEQLANCEKKHTKLGKELQELSQQRIHPDNLLVLVHLQKKHRVNAQRIANLMQKLSD